MLCTKLFPADFGKSVEGNFLIFLSVVNFATFTGAEGITPKARDNKVT